MNDIEKEKFIRKRYCEFKKLFGNDTSLLIKYLDSINYAGSLKQLIGMEDLTPFESDIIKKLLKGSTVYVKEIKHPLLIGEYNIIKCDFRVSENHTWSFLFKYDGALIYSIRGIDEDDAYKGFCDICKRNNIVSYKYVLKEK